MSINHKNIISGWALATVSILFLSFSILLSSCSHKDESAIWLEAKPNIDNDTLAVAFGEGNTGHVLYTVKSWSTTGASITSISLTEMSDETGLRLVETKTDKDWTTVSEQGNHFRVVKAIFDYEASTTKKDTASFTMIFHAEDNSGNTQDYHRRLTVVKEK